MTGVNYFLKRRRRYGILFLASLVSAAAGLFLVLTVRQILLYRLISHFLLNTGMILFCFGWHGRREFLENWAVTYFVIVLLGGILEWIQESGLIPPDFFLQTALVSLTGYGILLYLMQRKEMGNHICQVRIEKGTRVLCVKGYRDSGNRLRDPCTGRGVSILSRTKAELFFDPERDGIRYVPYRSLGETDGLLLVADVDALVLTDGKKERRYGKTAIGIADEGLLEGKEYDLILHTSML